MQDFDQTEITNFFANTIDFHNTRETYMALFPRSGYELIDKIPQQARILDVGCGKNLFKNSFPNLTGIDIIGTECDQQIDLLNYKTDKKFDVILCLGSIFGSFNDIKDQIAHMKTMLVPNGKIYWRNHPALPEWGFHPSFFYLWTIDTHVQLADEFDFEIVEVCKEYLPQGKYRIYAEWTSNT
jgi:2-polyprenyl-3-methyl-5-hydroxy-6-metoxy-1,4-benzoquinol methylase